MRGHPADQGRLGAVGHHLDGVGQVLGFRREPDDLALLHDGLDRHAADPVAPEPTTPRRGFVEGQVSFWRPGAPDWAQAQVNTPLAPGDELSTGSPGNLEPPPRSADIHLVTAAWGSPLNQMATGVS